jgi:anti-sigma factor RsiW
MLCERCNSRLSAYVDGTLTSAELRQVNAHLASCRRCREDVQEIQAIRRVLRSMPEHEAPAAFWDDTLRMIRSRARRKPAPFAYARIAGTAVAALALAIILFVNSADRQVIDVAPAHERLLTINPLSLVSLHARERGRSPLVDIAKVRIAGSEAEAGDLADDGRFDVK